jgi:phage-related protein
VGFALQQAQNGEKSLHAAPLVGFKGAGVLEVISDYDGDTYRAVYMVKLSEAHEFGTEQAQDR